MHAFTNSLNLAALHRLNISESSEVVPRINRKIFPVEGVSLGEDVNLTCVIDPGSEINDEFTVCIA
jgi:pyruvoyl-dependent arginine decarboxylase (PvlArgDC)